MIFNVKNVSYLPICLPILGKPTRFYRPYEGNINADTIYFPQEKALAYLFKCSVSQSTL